MSLDVGVSVSVSGVLPGGPLSPFSPGEPDNPGSPLGPTRPPFCSPIT